MKKILSVLFLFLSSFMMCQPKDTLRVGVYVDNIYDVDYLKSSFESIFYVWINSEEELIKEDIVNDVSNFLDIDRMIDFKVLLQEHNRNGNKHHYLLKIQAKILTKMDVSKFPFDKQCLDYYIELNTHYRGDKIIKLDTKNSLIKPNFIDKWKVGIPRISVKSKEWNSDFGNIKSDKRNVLDAINIQIPLVRDCWNIYWKMFTVLFISFFLTVVSVFLPNKLSEEKLALIVGSLFTAIGNKYITESYLPISDSFNLSDKIHLVTFVFIALFSVYAITEQRFKLKDSLKNDFIAFLISTLIYFGIVVSITISYLN
ncbi:ligand-gated ion channel [Flavobacterium stagni]|uniref:Neurotransmitter-gated ion-channel ligand-binding domain-containing protein n=1 Tax=Flavobacterium stagni TaxID=2506421 RepID=A0A4Q1K7C4_9FLAO|nr:hypothetical protein [Flavobacterium stagni]RXR21626.1 hypothetical protein EQG61_11485 [Flavobacterium stagni]